MRTIEFVRFAQSGSVSYDMGRKAKFHAGAEAVLKRLVKLLGLKKGEYDLSHNQGGIAVSGEITLHSDGLYVQLYQSSFPVGNDGKNSYGVLWRTCKGRKDYIGGRNNWQPWEDLKDLETVALRMKAAVANAALPMFQIV